MVIALFVQMHTKDGLTLLIFVMFFVCLFFFFLYDKQITCKIANGPI